MADWLRAGSGRRRAARNAVVGLLVLACIVAVSLVVVKTRTVATAASEQAAVFTPPPIVTPTAPPLPVVSIIGDDSTTRSASGVTAAQRWTSLLADAADVDVETYASTGAGYLTKGADGRTFLDQAGRVPADSEIVIVFGGISDALASETRLSRAVARTISEIRSRAPDARIAVVGPVTSGGQDADTVTAERTLLTNAVGSFGLQFIDPIQQAWLSRDYASGTTLGANEQKELARQFQVVVRQLTPAS